MRARLSISLSAIANNYRDLNSLCGDAQCAAVVKADAYGLGIKHIAPHLYQSGARDFFVALPEEAIELRELLQPDARIYVLNGLLPNEARDLLAYQLRPVLNSLESFASWKNAAPDAACAVQIDTGLNRLGLSLSEWEHLDKDAFNIQLALSHLACADTPEHVMNGVQRKRFADAAALYPDVRYSLAASDGIFCGSEFHFDMVRPGAALYGINPIPNRENPMQQVVTLQAPVLSVRQVESDGSVGYAASRSVTKGQNLAAIGIGYADGFFRSLSNQSHVLFQGRELPVLGRVSMDIVMVDISTLSETAIKPGDFVEILSPQQNVDQLGHCAGTIGYEFLTALGSRFTRVYT